ncbi:hypothetical protein [Agriterribacter humi]|uniref:hypothetical protein n=1 Tax=Agriterribacter humi TaxID=1104781 RepID=UPI00126448DB|nr:hypothetical protein [Agriterribacter humi]
MLRVFDQLGNICCIEVCFLQTHRLDHRLENKQYYEQLDIRLKMIGEYKELLSTLNNTTLLNKALSLGQITIIQYFYDESFYFAAYDKYLQTK